jgi:hypothetical protein
MSELMQTLIVDSPHRGTGAKFSICHPPETITAEVTLSGIAAAHAAT